MVSILLWTKIGIKEFKVKKVKLKFPDIKFELNIDIEYRQISIIAWLVFLCSKCIFLSSVTAKIYRTGSDHPKTRVPLVPAFWSLSSISQYGIQSLWQNSDSRFGEKNALNGFVTSYARKQGGNQRLMGYVRSKCKQTGSNKQTEEQTGANISKSPTGKIWEHIKNSDHC